MQYDVFDDNILHSRLPKLGQQWREDVPLFNSDLNNGGEDVPLVIYITVTFNNGGADVPLVIYITVTFNNGGADIPLVIYITVTFNNGGADVPLVIYITVTFNNGGADVPLVIYITVNIRMWPTITRVQTKNPILTLSSTSN